MSKTKRSRRSYYDPEDQIWDTSTENDRNEKAEMKERRLLKKMKNALRAKNLDVLNPDE